MTSRYAHRDRILRMDPRESAREIYHLTAYREFPWDLAQSLGLALVRTYAVPSIGRLLGETGEFVQNTQKRYDDTVLLMDAAIEHGLATDRGRSAVRRMNQMHRAYDISNEDLLYVLCTFVVVPIRWIDTWGWRPATEQEREASALLYGELGRHMGIRGLPTGYNEYARWMDDFEAEHFGYSQGGRDVTDATLRLLSTFFPFRLLPSAVSTRLAYALLDEPLLAALRLPRPTRFERGVVRVGLRVRARLERLMPPRRRDSLARDMASVRTYPRSGREAIDLERVGTFPGCPVDHESRPVAGARGQATE